jgi:hypothetical protein
MSLHTEWSTLQANYRIADKILSDYRVHLRVRYGTDVTGRVYSSRREQHKLDVLERAQARIYARIFVWLDKHSPWDWHAGTSAHWICSSLTADQALSDTPPVLPAESAGYGSPRVPHCPDRATAAPQATTEGA